MSKVRSPRRLLKPSVVRAQSRSCDESGRNWGLVSTVNLLSFQESRIVTQVISLRVTPLDIAFVLFDRAAARFQAEHKRPAVLVLDNINVVAQACPDLLYVFQQRAKTAADQELYKVVFVCSGGVAPRKLRGKLSPVHSEIQMLILPRELGEFPWP